MAWDEFSAPSEGGTNLYLNLQFAGDAAIGGQLSSIGMNWVSEAQYQAFVDALAASPLITNVVITNTEAVTRTMTKTPPEE